MRHKAYETRNLQLAPTGDGEDQETKYTQVSKVSCYLRLFLKEILLFNFYETKISK